MYGDPGTEAASRVALDRACEKTVAYKTALANAAQVLIDFRDKRSQEFNDMRFPTASDTVTHRKVCNRIDDALEHISRADGLALMAMRSARTIP